MKLFSYKNSILNLFFFMMTISTAFAQINFTTTKYCPSDPPTVFTVTEQTTTYYLGTSNSTALGACGVNWNMFDQNHYAAIDPGSWKNGAACGSCAMLTYNGHSTTVMIVDECGTCGSNSNHLDLSPTAYDELVNSPGCASIAGSTNGSVNTGGCPTAPGAGQVTWHFVQCSLAGSANISYNNAPGNITYEFKDGSNNGWHPIVFWDVLFPIQSVSVGTSTGGPFTALNRDTTDVLPNFWGGTGQTNTAGPLYYVITDVRGNSVTLGPINSISPLMQANNSSFVAYGTTTAQMQGCVVGPTNTPTKTNTPGSPTATYTDTFTSTATPTLTPISGCPYIYYNGTAPTNLASGAIPYQGNATLTETAAAAYTGDVNGMNIAFNVPVNTYFGEVEWNWANYTTAKEVNLASFSTLEFYVDNTTAAASPMTLNVYLSDYMGAGTTGQTQSNPVTIVLTGTGWNKIDIPLSSFSTGGASYTPTTIGEIDIKLSTTAAAETATVYVDNIAFYGTCPTNTPTRTNTNSPTFTNTFTLTPTSTYTLTKTNTPTSTNTSTNSMTFTATSTKTNSPTFTNTATSTFTNTLAPPTNTFTPTSTGTPTFTSTLTFTKTNTPTTTYTSTNTFTITQTNTPSVTNTSTITYTPTSTFTGTTSPTATPTKTLTPTLTGTSTSTSTGTSTSTFTFTSIKTPTSSSTFTSTFTATLTFTITNSPTLTYSPTITYTPTWTFTGTLSPSATPTNTGTPTKTLTFTPTASATATPTPVAIVSSLGPNPPSNSTQLPGVTSLPVLQFKLTNPGNNPATINSITLTGAGTGNFTTGITSVKLYLNPNGNGLVDSGDTLIGTAIYSGGTVTFNFATVIPAAANQIFLVAYDFSNSGPAGTYTTSLTSGTGTNSTGGVLFNGMPLGGPTVTIAFGTATPTNTGTSTYTPTSGWTPTNTNTPTFTGTSTNSFTPTNTQTVTNTSSITNSPTPTRTFSATPTATVPFVDIFTVDLNLFRPSVDRVVNINVQYNKFPGNYDMWIYNSVGEHIKTLDTTHLTSPVNKTYQWDGTNKNGDPCASGVYILYLVEPFDRKIKRIVLVR